MNFAECMGRWIYDPNADMKERDGPEALPLITVDDFIAEIEAEVNGQLMQRANRFTQPADMWRR